jgi:hypothetical protein
MGRYILRYGKAVSAPEQHVQTIVASKGVQVIDKSPNMLLVDADDETALRKTVAGLDGWSVHAEQQYPMPDTRHKIR